MPGTSWARAAAESSIKGAIVADATKAIRPIMKFLI
jgi:hypothetical protein